MDEAAIAAIRRNVLFNGLSEDVVIPHASDAVSMLMAHRTPQLQFDIVDVDPYGSVAPFMDSAVQAVAHGGMLAVTCTDMSVLAGNDMHACRAKYGAMPLKAPFFGEQALRIVLGALETTANRYRRVIQPLMSVCVDFYIRVFVRVWDSAGGSTESGLRLGHIVACAQCDAFWAWPQGVRTKRKQRPPPAARAGRKRARAGDATAPTDSDAQDAGDGAAEDTTAASCAPVAVPTSRIGEEDLRRVPAYVSDGAESKQQGPRVLANTCPPFGTSCAHCGGRLVMAGPMWLDPIHDKSFVDAVLSDMTQNFGADGYGQPGAAAGTPAYFYDLSRAVARPSHDGGSNDVDTVATSRQRLMGIVRTISEELHDVPLYYDLPSFFSQTHLSCVPTAPVIAALRAAGYRASATHASRSSLKTDAPVGFIWDIFRAWVQSGRGTIAAKHLEHAGSLSARLLSAPPAFPEKVVDFSGEKAVAAERSALKAATGPRFVSNPGENWGPGSRASAAIAASKSGKRARAAAGGDSSRTLAEPDAAE